MCIRVLDVGMLAMTTTLWVPTRSFLGQGVVCEPVPVGSQDNLAVSPPKEFRS
jgi:hypothetical protein